MKFSDFFNNYKLTARPQQIEILQKLDTDWDNYKYFAISAPTGVGKTYAALAIADKLHSSYLLTGTKDLQAQYQRSSAKVVDLKGRSNYVCNINPIFNVDEAPCLANKELKTSCIRAKTCDYYNQKAKALSSQMMITNYAYFLTVTSNSDPEDTDWVQRESVIMDEAHELESHLISMAEIKMNLTDLYINFGVPHKENDWRFTQSQEDNMKLLDLIFQEMQAKIARMQDQIDAIFEENTFMQGTSKSANAKNLPKSVAEKIRKINSKKSVLQSFVTKIMVYFNTADFEDSPWIQSVNEEENSIILSPLTAKYLFKFYMSNFGEKFVFVSATMPPADVLCKELGIDRSEMLYIEVGTPFEPEKSPIIALPIAKMNYKEIDNSIPKIIEAVEAILDGHQTKGVIHTGNYKVAKAILDGVDSKTRDRLVARDMGNSKVNNADLLKLHYNSDEPTVLLSPSMTTGVDLYDDLARFQIIVKLPFGSLGDARIKKKADVYPDWYLMQMWIAIMQASGRATRNEDDFSTTYILDASFEYFLSKAKSKLPKWFLDRIQY